MTSMATRKAVDIQVPLHECTEFVLHTSQRDGSQTNIIDFGERRLIQIISRATDAQQKLALIAMLNDYMKGFVAVAWVRGRPVHMKVTKGS